MRIKKEDFGFDFVCTNKDCKLEAVAETASDVHAVKCNQSIEYFIICPNCGTKVRIKSEEIPAHIKSYIKVNARSIMTYHD